MNTYPVPSDNRGPEDNELYPVVRRAVEDALWNVVGSVVYGLFLVLLGLVGLQLLLFGLFTRTVTAPTVAVFAGGGLCVIAAAVGLLRLAGMSPV